MPTTSITGAAIDGRAQTPVFIQQQLRSLHKAIRGNRQELQNALIADMNITSDEAALEIGLTIAAIRRRFLETDIPKTIDDEYRVAAGQSWAERSLPAGVVLIRPQSQNLLYSIVAPLSSAIAAGNCVIVELNESGSQIALVIKQALYRELDRDTFSIVDSIAPDSISGEFGLLVDQLADVPSTSVANELRRPSAQSRVIAIVDRTANLATAAKQIVEARVTFHGQSVYAPDLVLVNGFILDDFLQAAVSVLSGYMSSGRKSHTGNKTQILAQDERSNPETTVVLEGDLGSLIKVGNRELGILSRKLNAPSIVVHPISSMDDAIDCANSANSPLLAAYHFAALPAAKYTSQFVRAQASWINHIPIELQVGPAAPLRFVASATDRYRPEMFSISSPLFVGTAQETKDTSAIIKRSALEDLPPDTRRSGKLVGFFDQGLRVGATAILLPLLTGVSIAGYYGAKFGVGLVMKKGLRWR